MKPLTLLLCLPCLALAKPPSQPVPVPDDIRVEKDVSYLANDRKEKADLYFPKTIAAGEKLPAIVFIHGGGFNDGDKARQREVSICSDLARGGYVAMSINYKLWNKGVKHPTWPQSVYDAKTAVRWLRKNAATIGINPDRIGAIGGSAGGNLASMLAVTGPADGLDPKEPLGDVSARVSCAVDLYGAVDLPNYHDMKMFLKTRAEDAAVYAKGSPINYCDKHDPPMLLIHGTADEVVDHSQSATFAAKLKAAGVEHEFVSIPGAPHSFDLHPAQRDIRDLVLGFFDKHLKATP
ncbi:MAG: alpha/beta hydrolase [Verrucomicrobiaceae bacterium]|nr:alpha/beta hydrolase [Verrucomicrobiaceae bacterium]